MIAACLVKRSASRPRSRIIRAPCPFTTPLETVFLLVPARAAHYTQDPSDTQSFSAKKPVLAGLSAPSWPSEIGNPALPTFRVATDTLNKVRFERDRGLRN